MNKIVKIFAAIAILTMAGIVMFNCGGGTSSDSTTDSTAVDTAAVVVDTTSVSGGAGDGTNGEVPKENIK
jgi:ABC-type glycerol-3-phosphate transport system substrate-binding protein